MIKKLLIYLNIFSCISIIAIAIKIMVLPTIALTLWEDDYKEMGKTTDNTESIKAYDELLKRYEKKDHNNVLSKWKDATVHDLGFTAPLILKGQIQTNEKEALDSWFSPYRTFVDGIAPVFEGQYVTHQLVATWINALSSTVVW